MTHADDPAAAVTPKGDRALAITRTFSAPVEQVYRAWAEGELFRRWWVPESVPGIALVSCDIDMRTGGTYRLEFGTGGNDTMAFYGKYTEVVPKARIVWTNDEGEEGGVTTVRLEDLGGATRLTYEEAYLATEARDEALNSSAAALPEQFDQLAALLAAGPGAREPE